MHRWADARCVAIANDYDEVQIGALSIKRLSHAEAFAFIRDGKWKRYDTAVVDVFLSVMGGGSKTVVQTVTELAMTSEQI